MTNKYSNLLCAGLLLAASGTAFAADVGGTWAFEGGLDPLTKGEFFCEYTGTLNFNQSGSEISGTASLQGVGAANGLCADGVEGFIGGEIFDVPPIKGGSTPIIFAVFDGPPPPGDMKGVNVLAIFCGTVDAGSEFMEGGWTTTPAICAIPKPMSEKGFPLPAGFGDFVARRVRSPIPALGPIGLGGLVVMLGLIGFAALRRRRS